MGNDPNRIISPVEQSALGITPKQDAPTVLLLRLEHKAVGRPGAVNLESEGAQTWRFSQGTTKEQVQALLGAVSEWCKAIPGVEVEFSVRED